MSESPEKSKPKHALITVKTQLGPRESSEAFPEDDACSVLAERGSVCSESTAADSVSPAFEIRLRHFSWRPRKAQANGVELFFRRLCASMRQDFGARVALARPPSIRGEATSTDASGKPRPKPHLAEWYKSVKSLTGSDLLESLGFTRNYSRILANVFDSELLRQHYLDALGRVLSVELRSKLSRRCTSSETSQEALAEMVLSLFWLHLDVPEWLRRCLSAEARCVIVVVVLSMCFDVQHFRQYVRGQLSGGAFGEDLLFDLEFCPHYSADQNRHLYFGVWFFRQTLENYRAFTADSEPGARLTSDLLFGFPSVSTPGFVFSTPLSELISGIDLAVAQEFFVLARTRLRKQPKHGRQPRLQTIYYYPKPQTKRMSHFVAGAKDLNADYLGQLAGSPRTRSRSLRRRRKHQAVCIYLGPRLIKFLQSKMGSHKAQFSVSARHLTDFTFWRAKPQPNRQAVNAAFNRKLTSSYKVSVNLLRTLMCTDEYAFYSEQFWRSEFLRSELEHFLSQKVLFGNHPNIDADMVARVYFRARHSKLPWTVVDRLNSISYVSELEGRVDASFLKSN